MLASTIAVIVVIFVLSLSSLPPRNYPQGGWKQSSIIVEHGGIHGHGGDGGSIEGDAPATKTALADNPGKEDQPPWPPHVVNARARAMKILIEKLKEVATMR